MKDLQLAKEQRSAVIEDIKCYFLNEKDEMITDLSAALLLDFILMNIGPHIYNQAIKDAHFLMSEKVDDLFELEKSLRIDKKK
ncbi:DUF2164 domain-containing protein [Sporomusa sp.]|uniref:DUF2164 domain-containing protein n=1 Tax=Sporomusa sp. TaxID=2078658 RepID=UPI002C4425DB|nr:DUF2164 domain-containing protein [Sporomusa sp.]HWR43242.1 DUF2164 domain-containing protein [Sporomusa sp.]